MPGKLRSLAIGLPHPPVMLHAESMSRKSGTGFAKKDMLKQSDRAG
jgi:hypothetical protein